MVLKTYLADKFMEVLESIDSIKKRNSEKQHNRDVEKDGDGDGDTNQDAVDETKEKEGIQVYCCIIFWSIFVCSTY